MNDRSSDFCCPIWRTSATTKSFAPPYVIDSPRAGGQYSITLDAYADAKNWDPDDKNLVTSWLYEQRQQGKRCPEVSIQTLEIARKRGLPSVIDRADNLLRYISPKNDDVQAFVEFSAVEDMNDSMTQIQLLVWTASVNMSAVLWLADTCCKNGWIEHETHSPPNSSNVIHKLRLTFQGHQRLVELGDTNS